MVGLLCLFALLAVANGRHFFGKPSTPSILGSVDSSEGALIQREEGALPEPLSEPWRARLHGCREKSRQLWRLVRKRPRATLCAALLARLVVAHVRIQAGKRAALTRFRRAPGTHQRGGGSKKFSSGIAISGRENHALSTIQCSNILRQPSFVLRHSHTQTPSRAVRVE